MVRHADPEHADDDIADDAHAERVPAEGKGPPDQRHAVHPQEEGQVANVLHAGARALCSVHHGYSTRYAASARFWYKITASSVGLAVCPKPCNTQGGAQSVQRVPGRGG